MKTLLLAGVAALTVGMAAPAAAQFYVGADPGGVGVQVGPFGAGVGPRYHDPSWRSHRWDGAYAAYGYGDCRTIRERVMTPSGRTIVKTQRVCD
jgi:hypothetical protein